MAIVLVCQAVTIAFSYLQVNYSIKIIKSQHISCKNKQKTNKNKKTLDKSTDVCYYMDSGKEAVKMFRKLVKKRMVDLEINQAKLAEMIGRSRQALCISLKNDNLRENDMRKIADAMNCDLVIELRPRDGE